LVNSHANGLSSRIISVGAIAGRNELLSFHHENLVEGCLPWSKWMTGKYDVMDLMKVDAK
jgi:hypothetical protein